MKIPTETFYYVLCYAWERLDHVRSESREVREAAGDDLPQNLLARLLCESFARVRRRGLDRGYRERIEDTRRPRGKVDLAATVGRALRARAQVAVRFEELTADVLQNRLVKTTMQRLAALPKSQLDGGLRSKLTRFARLMPEVDDVELRDDFFRRVQIHRNNADYGFLLSVCRFLSSRLFPEDRQGFSRFREFDADDTEMGHLFEAFVRGFLRLERPALRVRGGNREISWSVPSRGAPRVPNMYADIFVPPAPSGRSVIVEAKCEAQPFADDGKSLKSRHLYQLWAYLTNYARSMPEELPPAGVLLHATIGKTFSHEYEFGDHSLRVRSLDLGQPWPELRRDLLRFADEVAEATGAETRSAA